MTTQILVTKRDQRTEPLDIEKIHRILEYATSGLNASISEIEMNASLNFYQGISTVEIHDSLIKSAVNCISTEYPDYQYVAGRLLLYHLRKTVWGESEPPRLWEHIQENKSLYDERIFEYSESEVHKINKFIDHSRDDKFTYSGLNQFIDKYAIQNRITHEIYETPQFCYMLIAMCLFSKYPKNSRLKHIKRAYDAFSKFYINLPTPIMRNVRTPRHHFSSCTLIDVGDSLDSIFASVHAIGRYTASNSGIGANIGRIRNINSPIRGGEEEHAGVIPFLKVIEAATKSCTQAGSRRGAATINCQYWNKEIMSILPLKNNAGTDENRVRKVDYAISFDNLFFDRLKANENISLFSSIDVPGLYEAYGSAEFSALYKKYEQDDNISRITIHPMEIIKEFMKERIETNRIYALFIDNANSQSPFTDTVKMTNLCCEILQPTVPMNSIDDENGRVGLCTLSAINLLETPDEEMENVCDTIVRLLDEVLDYQDYPVKAVENFNKDYRSLGVGVTNFAAWLAKKGLKYEADEATIQATDEKFEDISYYLTSASVNLAKKKGKCRAFNKTKYANGEFPIDLANKNAKALCGRKLKHDWKELSERVSKHGIRNATLMAISPTETSSIVQNSTNGIDPPRSPVVKKFSTQVVPNLGEVEYKYAFDCDNEDIIKIVATMQKYMDMGISTNLYYDKKKFPEGKIPLKLAIQHFVLSAKLGLKTLYYCYTRQDNAETITCSGGACAI